MAGASGGSGGAAFAPAASGGGGGPGAARAGEDGPASAATAASVRVRTSALDRSGVRAGRIGSFTLAMDFPYVVAARLDRPPRMYNRGALAFLLRAPCFSLFSRTFPL